MKKTYSLLLALSISTLSHSVYSQTTVTQVGSMGFGVSWLDDFVWSDGNPAQSGADYVLDRTGWRLRTPDSGSQVFPGDSLTLSNMSDFLIKMPLEGSGEAPFDVSYDFSNLTINNATIKHGGNTNFGTARITGNLNVIGSMVIDTAQWERAIFIESAIAGNGVITIEQTSGNGDGRGVVTLTNSENTFDGTLEVLSTGTLDLDYDAENFSSIVVDGLLIVDQAIVVPGLTINGTVVADGMYAAADLETTFPGFVQAGESGSITVGEVAAAIVTQVRSMSGGVSWIDGFIWSDGNPAQSGFEYVVDTSGWKFRTPADGSYVFPGDSLTIANSSEMLIKMPTEELGEMPFDVTYEFSDLFVENGIIKHGGNTNFGTGRILGSLTVKESMTVDTAQWSRAIVIEAVVSGEGVISITQGSGNADGRGIVTFSNSENTFSGDFEVLGTGTLDFDYDANLMNVSVDGLLVVDQVLSVETLLLSGTTVEAGTYTAAELAAQYPGTIQAEETGTVTVRNAGSPTWAGLPVTEGWVNSESFGPLYVANVFWVYIQNQGVWVYLPPAWYNEGGIWNFMLAPAPAPEVVE